MNKDQQREQLREDFRITETISKQHNDIRFVETTLRCMSREMHMPRLLSIEIAVPKLAEEVERPDGGTIATQSQFKKVYRFICPNCGMIWSVDRPADRDGELLADANTEAEEIIFTREEIAAMIRALPAQLMFELVTDLQGDLQDVDSDRMVDVKPLR